MRALLKTLQFVLLLVAIIAAISAALSIAGMYMVLAGYVQPGEPMYLDELAPSVTHASLTMLVSATVIALALVGRWRVERWIRSNAS